MNIVSWVVQQAAWNDQHGTEGRTLSD